MARPRSDIRPRLVAAARARFLSHGVDGASLRDIARDAGTNIGMIYYYFPTKDDLLLAVLEERYAVMVEDFIVALAPDAPPAERIRRLYRRVGRMSDEELVTLKLIAREALGSTERLKKVLERFQKGHLPLVFRAFMDGMSDGTFDASLPLGVIAMSAMSIGMFPQLLRRSLGPTPLLPFAPGGEELSELLFRVVMRGIKAETAPVPPETAPDTTPADRTGGSGSAPRGDMRGRARKPARRGGRRPSARARGDNAPPG